MAKKRPTGNKSAAIREALNSNPGKGPTEISAILKERGWRITPAYVSIVKSAGKTKAIRKVRVQRKVPASRRSVPGNGLVAAANFIREAGGLNEAREILRTLEEIRSTLR